ncbi:DUF72 domain-containing protein [uncultured Aeromicrobium sp.]|uniref:DUF72 domain-containing protein n=1 Tax=uncultured Aeromicrobium sp. TaxID=337820 RepID=UPI0025FC0D0F|nr:DUF72 domain-containing protein [uncultured Aeromicrobium sp.]
MHVRIGVSGWSYRSWHGDYYPSSLRKQDELAYLSSRLCTVEVNASFYRLQRPTTYQRWYETVAPGFRFAVKGGRYLTHLRRLREPRESLANFLASGVLALRDRLGPLLWQLPADFDLASAELPAFLEVLPRTYAEARRIARDHGQVLSDPERRWLGDDEHDALPVHHALEVRSDVGIERLLPMLTEYDVALVASDGAGMWPVFSTPTASFAYIRLHGPEILYHGGYADGVLEEWAASIVDWGRDTWVYFDNDADGRAPHDAERLVRILRDRSECIVPGVV